MLNFIDNFLNKTTMYRLVLYVLIFFVLAALALSISGLISFSPLELIFSLIVILIASTLSNKIFSYALKATTNTESVYITGLILFFLITPVSGNGYANFFPLAVGAPFLAMASKYILAIRKKHIFNPAAIAMVILALTIDRSANWWIGMSYMLPFVLIGGILIARKLRHTGMILAFFATAFLGSLYFYLTNSNSLAEVLPSFLLSLTSSPIFFFAFVMLTEPLTSPNNFRWRLIFGMLVGIFFMPTFHIGSYYSTPELALVLGNIFAYIVSPKEKLFLKLREKTKIARDTYEFVFEKNRAMNFEPGEYMEWTLSQNKADNRGNRRYFTIASSPTEAEFRLGLKFYPEPSSFKKELLGIPLGSTLVASGRAGDFVLPKNKNEELVFIAGGIGITPFRSMLRYLIDKNEKRNIVLLYSNRTVGDIAYRDILEEAREKLNIHTIYSITDEEVSGQSFRKGFIDGELIKKIPNYQDKIFYISGPHGMVNAFEKTLKSIGIPRKRIKIDFFPGFV